jgi:uncharacterized protein YjiS (DUF1127 family)
MHRMVMRLRHRIVNDIAPDECRLESPWKKFNQWMKNARTLE